MMGGAVWEGGRARMSWMRVWAGNTCLEGFASVCATLKKSSGLIPYWRVRVVCVCAGLEGAEAPLPSPPTRARVRGPRGRGGLPSAPAGRAACHPHSTPATRTCRPPLTRTRSPRVIRFSCPYLFMVLAALDSHAKPGCDPLLVSVSFMVLAALDSHAKPGCRGIPRYQSLQGIRVNH